MTTQKSFLPYIIIGVFALFMTFILQFVFRSMQSKVQLVSKNYYQQEINYQSHIDKLKRSSEIKEATTFTSSDDQFTIQLPKEISAANGEMYVYNSIDSNLDFTIPFSFTANMPLSFSTEALSQGVWTVKVDFESEGEKYFVERTFVK